MKRKPNDLDNAVDAICQSYRIIAKIKPTFCFEILAEMQRKLKDRLTLDRAHYTVDGYRHYVTDFDGQKYQIDIKPIREEVSDNEK